MSSSCHHLNFRDALFASAEVNNHLFSKHGRHVKYVPQQGSPSARSAQGTLPTSTGFMHSSIIIKKADTQPRSWKSDSVSLLKQQNSSNRIRYPPFVSTSYKPLPSTPDASLSLFYIPRETCLVKWNNLLHHHKLRLLHPAIRQSKPHRSQIFRLGQFASLSRWLQRKKEPASNVNYQSTS
jgi:hypothetical protein